MGFHFVAIHGLDEDIVITLCVDENGAFHFSWGMVMFGN